MSTEVRRSSNSWLQQPRVISSGASQPYSLVRAAGAFAMQMVKLFWAPAPNMRVSAVQLRPWPP
jgi:hypothetical protein